MLSRTVLAKRALRYNLASPRHPISPQHVRSYAHGSPRRPGKTKLEPPVLEQSYLEHADPSKGPVKNRTWPPASSSPLVLGGRGTSVTKNPQRPQPPEAPRIRNQVQQQQAFRFSTSPRASLPPSSGDPKSTEAPDPPPKDQGASQEASHQPPLPDLRQGIPSTFEQEISDRSSSIKDEESRQPSLDLTEDPTQEDQEQNRRRGDEPREAYKSSIERRRENMAFYGFLTGGAILLASVLALGQNWDEREARGHPDIPNGWTPGAVYSRARTRLSETLGYYTEPAFPQLLPNVDPRYKPPYTLVLSLEDLLVSSKWTRQNGWEVAKRPGLDYFIRYLSQYYELVLFTSVPSMNGQPVYAKLDPYHFIMFPLFREATRYMNGQHVKDLAYLNRDLSKTILIDTDTSHAQLQPENAVVLPKWSGQPKDERATDLVAMIPFLEYIAGMNIEDVRKVIKSFEGTDIPTEYARREAVAREAFNKQQEKDGRTKKHRAGSSGGFGTMLGFKPSPQPGQLPGEPSIAEGFAQGKMLIDQVRERGRMQYEQLEHDIRVNGQTYLEEQEREEKKMMEEQMKSMKNDWMTWPTKMFGGSSKPAEEKG